MEGGRAVQARDGWREREHERGMLGEKDGIFIAAVVFIAAQRRGERGGVAWVVAFALLCKAERERGRGWEERGSSDASERARGEAVWHIWQEREERKAGGREGCFRVCA